MQSEKGVRMFGLDQPFGFFSLFVDLSLCVLFLIFFIMMKSFAFEWSSFGSPKLRKLFHND